MAAASFLKSVYLRYLSKPASERTIHTLIRRNRIGTIVELGVGNTLRAQRMIEIAQRYHDGEVCYAGVDQFESRPESENGVPLKEAYKRLRPTRAKIQLIPGDPFASLARAANGLTGTRLLIVSADQDEQSLERAWFYVPRMLDDDAHVLIERMTEDPSRTRLDRLSLSEIEALAGDTGQRRRAA